jgi:hypothetical protein
MLDDWRPPGISQEEANRQDIKQLRLDVDRLQKSASALSARMTSAEVRFSGVVTWDQFCALLVASIFGWLLASWLR